MAGYSQYVVRLHRDALDTPWGFRLQGGADVGHDLSVQRVFSGTAAEGDLQRGDLLTAIDNRSTAGLDHIEAQNIIKSAGGSILLHIKRPPAGSVPSPVSPKPKLFQPSVLPKSQPQSKQKAMSFHPGHKPSVQKKAYGGPGPEFGVDYSKRGQIHSPGRQPSGDHYMLNKVQKSLDNAIHSPGAGSGGRYDPELVDTSPQYIPLKAPVPMYENQPVSPYQQQGYPQTQHQQYQQPDHRQAPPMYQQQQQHQQHHQQYQYQQPPQPYRQDSYNQPPPQQPEPFRPFSQQTVQVQYQQIPVQNQQPDEDEEYEHVPVSERKKNFMKRDDTPRHIQPQLKKSVAKAPRITQQNRTPEFGVDYSRQPHHQPIAPPVHHPFQMSPAPPTPENPHTSPDVFVPGKPAWRGTLKSSGFKTWNNDAAMDDCFSSEPQQQFSQPPPPTSPKPRSGLKQPERNVQSNQPASSGKARSVPILQSPPQHSRVRSVPIQKPWEVPATEESAQSPKVVHLQYNSPINMYSRDNVEETFQGQVAQATTPQTPQQKVPFGQEPRDWEQSAVYRMVHASDQRDQRPPPQQPPPGQRQGQQPRRNIEEEIGISDF